MLISTPSRVWISLVIFKFVGSHSERTTCHVFLLQINIFWVKDYVVILSNLRMSLINKVNITYALLNLTTYIKLDIFDRSTYGRNIVVNREKSITYSTCWLERSSPERCHYVR